MKILTKAAYVILFFLLVGGAIFFSAERNRVAFGGRGSIEKGQKFGVKIGDSRKDAIAHLEDSEFLDVTLLGSINDNPQLCDGVVYDDDFRVDIFLDETWRSGAICLVSQDGIVVRMSWNYGFMEI
jgi:hypothetical protein